jgi:alkylation response protein AidB-like acyl-CoA dehydrogenase
MGLDPSKLIIYNEESERFGIARTPGELGVLLLGPVLISHGTKEQQDKYLPKILNGDDVWCQGYSEPNAGSDLASLATTAVLDGDEYVINGQKTWTTRASESNCMFVLARTDKDAIKQKGISFFLLDFDTPGITIRPIENLAGHAEFAEVFLDDVRIPKENLVGELNDGWTIAKSLLTFERLFSGSPQQSRLALFRLQTFVEERGLDTDPVIAAKLNEFRMDVLDLEAVYAYFADFVRRGEALGPDIASLKIFGTATCQKISEFMVEVAGVDASSLGYIEGTSVDIMSQYYYSRPITIFGGTSEIQRNILSKAILELPSR